MIGRILIAAGSAVALAVATGVARRYRRELEAAERRLASQDRSFLDTDDGQLEYAASGAGAPVLVSHGIFHGFDGGLLSVGDLVEGHRIISPSRFGYLGTTMPADATVAGQADAFALLLDHLELDAVDVVAISAGTGAAVQLALRHPDRVEHLVISSGNFPGSATAQAPPGWAKRLYSDRAMWALATFVPPMFATLMGIPDGFPTNDEEAEVVERMLGSIFPVGPRAQGAIFDADVSNPEIGSYPLEELQVPTLVVHARDDPLASYDAAVDAARRIPGSVLLTLDSGGHLQLGQSARVRAELASFLRRPVGAAAS